jgi:hypothetical protein
MTHTTPSNLYMDETGRIRPMTETTPEKIEISESAYIACYDLALIRSALGMLNQCARTDNNAPIREATKILAEREIKLTECFL